jgi:hypothetical protein
MLVVDKLFPTIAFLCRRSRPRIGSSILVEILRTQIVVANHNTDRVCHLQDTIAKLNSATIIYCLFTFTLRKSE